MQVVSAHTMQQLDHRAINNYGIAGSKLMENAGQACAERIVRDFGLPGNNYALILAGKGNNGGDGYVIARHLLNAGVPTRVVLCGDPAKVQGDARINLDVLERLGHRVECVNPLSEGAVASIRGFGGDASLIVDALFGTGLRGQLRPEYLAVVEAINALGRPILAVDIPSGLDCDTGRPLGAAIRAAYTVTFVAVKKGFLASPEAESYVGELHVASIGVEPPM